MLTPSKFNICTWQDADSMTLTDEYQIKPHQYLDFAKIDLEEQGGSRSLINAISNAKRALHLRTDVLTDALGFQHTKLKNNFPSKISFCEQCGVSGRRILAKINRLRNIVEHDYYVPSQEECENFIDITELFITSTTDIVNNFPRNMTLVSEEIEEICGQVKIRLGVAFPPGKGIVSISIKELDDNLDVLHQEAARMLEVYERRFERLKIDYNSDSDPLPTSEQLRESAYIQACHKVYNKMSFDIVASDDALYTNWVKFVITKSREA